MKPHRQVDTSDTPLQGTSGAPLLNISCAGQASVEYLFVLFGFLAILLALGACWHAFRASDHLQSLVQASSHTGDQGFMGGLQDLLLY